MNIFFLRENFISLDFFIFLLFQNNKIQQLSQVILKMIYRYIASLMKVRRIRNPRLNLLQPGVYG